MAALILTLFEHFEVRTSSNRPIALPSRKAQALLAYLGAHPGQPQARDKLTALLWPDADDKQARQSLRQTLFELRRALAPVKKDVLRIEGDTVELDPGAVEVDAASFERLVNSGTPEGLEQAAALYHGDLLEGFIVKAEPFEDWLLAERERIRELAQAMLGKLLARQAGAGPAEPAIRTALRLLSLDPLQEAAHRTLMRLYVRQSRRTAALKQYQLCVAVLGRELGVEPDPETRELYQEILQQQLAPRQAPAAPARPHQPRRRGWRARGDSSDKPLVGRSAELARLERALRDAWSGQGQMALVLGEAGIGKTRLMEVLAAEAVARGGRAAIGRAYESEQMLPFQPWIDALRAAQVQAEGEVVDRLSPALRAELSRLFPELGDAAALPPVSADNATRLFEAVLDLIGRMTERQPLVVILEDLHWADEMSLRLLSFLARRVTSRGVLLAATAREEELAGAPVLRRLVEELAPERCFLPLELVPLSRRDTAALVRALARAGSDEDWLARIAEQAWALSEGNPFVVVECMRTLPDRTARPEVVALPKRVREVIAGRLERLGDRARQLAAVGAVVGREFSFALAQRATGLDAEETAAGMEELVRRRFLDVAGEQFAFAHDRIRQVAYESLLAPRRQALHAAVGAAIESLHADGLGQVSDQLAYHYSQAGVTDKAITHLTSLAKAAHSRYALSDAARWLEQALGFVDQLEATERDARRLPLVLAKAFVLSNLGRFSDIVALLLPQRERLEALAEPRLASQYFFRLGLTYSYLGRYREAENAAMRALERAQRAGEPALMGQAHHVLSLKSFFAGKPQIGVEHAREGIRLLGDTTAEIWFGLAYVNLALNSHLLGELDAALEASRTAVEVGRRINDARLLSLAVYISPLVHAAREEWEAALAACRKALDVSRDPFTSAAATAITGCVKLGMGQPGEACSLLGEAVESFERFGTRHIASRFMAWRAEAHLDAGDVASAKRWADQALALGSEGGSRWSIGLAHRALARIAMAGADLEEAERRLRDALATFEAMPAPLETAHAHVLGAELSGRRGNVEACARHLIEAHRLFRERGVPRRQACVEDAARALGVALPAIPDG
jgi:DNA-binding SARP family transcriptional activator